MEGCAPLLERRGLGLGDPPLSPSTLQSSAGAGEETHGAEPGPSTAGTVALAQSLHSGSLGVNKTECTA